MSNLSWFEIQELHAHATPSTYGSHPHVMFHGKDCADKYAILRTFGEDGQDDLYYFYLFLEANLEVAEETRVYNNAAEAIAWLAYRFLLDNADGSDAYNPLVQANHNRAQSALANLIDP